MAHPDFPGDKDMMLGHAFDVASITQKKTAEKRRSLHWAGLVCWPVALEMAF